MASATNAFTIDVATRVAAVLLAVTVLFDKAGANEVVGPPPCRSATINSEAYDVTDSIMGLSNEQFWGDLDGPSAVARRKLLKSGEPAFLIDGPKNVSVDRQRTIPVVVFNADDNSVLSMFKPQLDGVITAVDLRENRLFANMAWQSSRSVPRNSGTAPMGPGRGAESFVVELRERLQIPWRNGQYLVTLVLRDRVSNRLQVALAADSPRYVDPEVERFIAQRSASAPLPDVFPPVMPSARFPVYSPQPGMPMVPREVGIDLRVPRVLEYDDSASPFVLSGSFRLPTQYAHRAKSAGIKQGSSPDGVIPIHILAVGSSSRVPQVYPLMLPVYGSPGDGADTVTGVFAIDMNTISRLSGPQTYFIYAFSGAFMCGPAIVGLVPPK